MFRLISRLVSISIFLAAALFFGRDFIFTFALKTGITMSTGLPSSIEVLRTGFLLKRSIDIRGLKIHNPSEFSDEAMLDIPRLYIDYDWNSLLKRKVAVRDMELTIDEFVVIKNSKGKVNIASVKLPKNNGDGIKDIAIDDLRLKIGTLTFKDYSLNPPVIKEFKLNIDERFHDVRNAGSLVRIVMAKALTRTSIGELTGFDVAALKDSVAGILDESESSLKNTINQTLKKTTDAFKNILETPKAK